MPSAELILIKYFNVFLLKIKVLKIILLWVLILSPFFLLSQNEQDSNIYNFDIKKESIFLPNQKKTWSYHHALNVSIIYLPNSWLESTVSAPMIHYKSNFYLPYNFALISDIKTLAVANEVRLGARYHLNILKKYFIGAGFQMGYNFGMLNDYGFDNKVYVFQNHPELSVGFTTNKFAFTLMGKLDLINKVYYSAGELNTSTNVKQFNGYSLGICMEQQISKKKSFSLGFIMNRNQFHILGWPAFNVIRTQYWIPEAFFGFKL